MAGGEATERFLFRSAVFLILRDGGKILMYRRISRHEGGNYGVISGHLDGDETAQQGIIREAKEEIGVSIEEGDLKVLHVMHLNIRDGAGEYFNIFMSADKWTGEIQNLEPDRCSELTWFDQNQLPDNTIEYVRQALDYIDKGIFYSNFGFN
jgi:ADP-ribose pyrophosphatase YjhB (NUDIX family)